MGGFLDRSQELVKRIGKQQKSFIQQFPGDVVHRNPHLFEGVHVILRGFEIFGEAGPRLAMVAEGTDGGRRHRVDGIRTDQFFNIDHIAVIRILGAGTGPQHALSLGAALGKILPAILLKNAEIALISQLRISNGDLSQDAAQQGLFRRISNSTEPGGGECVHGGIDTADEKAGDAGNFADIESAPGKLFEAVDVSLCNLLVQGLREQQRDVDVDAFADELPEGGNPLRRRRDFDHHVFAAHGLP